MTDSDYDKWKLDNNEVYGPDCIVCDDTGLVDCKDCTGFTAKEFCDSCDNTGSVICEDC